MSTQGDDPATEPAGPSDAELITATRMGDTAAFDLLYRRHLDAANRLARTLVRDRSAADDLVAEAFAKVLATLRAGHGPDLAFRGYLLTSLRNTFYDHTRRERRLQVTDDMTPYDPGEPFVDAASEGLERSLAARAFARLPERWQTVLWHTEVEGETPAEVAPILGLTPNGVSALAYRARERLRQAYLQEHIADTAEPDCHWTAERLGARVRKGLSAREREKVDQHLEDCAKCKLLYVELTEVNAGLRGVLAPIVVGSTWAAYLGLGTAAKGAAAAGVAGGGAGLVGWFQHGWQVLAGGGRQVLTKVGPRNAALGGGAAAAAAVVVAALLLTSSPPNPPKPKPPRAAPVQPPAQPPPANPPAQPPPAAPPPANPPAPPPRPAPSPTGGYHVSSPAFTVGTLTAGDSNGSLPITVSNNTGGGGGGTGGGTGQPLPPLPGTAPPNLPVPHGAALPTAVPLPTGLPAAPGAAAPQLTLVVKLPAPMTFGGAAMPGDGWSCLPTAGGASCRHAELAPGTSSTLKLGVRVGDLSGFRTVGTDLTGPVTYSTTFPVVVAPHGTRTTYAGAGRQTLVTVGNTLVRGGKPTGHDWPGRRSGRPCPINDDCETVPYHGDSGAPRGGIGSGGRGARSRSNLTIPAGATVRHAELYWSGRGNWGKLPTTVSLRNPGGMEALVTASSSGSCSCGSQRSADVTALVARGGAGLWMFGTPDVPHGYAYAGAYAGWALSVVLDNPGAPVRNVALFTGPVELHGRPITAHATDRAGPVQVGLVAWDGDRRLPDGSLGDDTLSIGTARTVSDVGRSSTAGAPEAGHDPNWNTLGTDAASYEANVGGSTDVRLRTGTEFLTVGALVLAGPS